MGLKMSTYHQFRSLWAQETQLLTASLFQLQVFGHRDVISKLLYSPVQPDTVGDYTNPWHAKPFHIRLSPD